MIFMVTLTIMNVDLFNVIPLFLLNGYFYDDDDDEKGFIKGPFQHIPAHQRWNSDFFFFFNSASQCALQTAVFYNCYC